VNGGYAIGINGEKWVSDLYISNQNTGYYFQFEPNEHYVVYFKPDRGYTQYKDAGNNVTEFYAFPNTDYQLAISKANILGTSYIPLQVKSTLYKCVIGTFDTDSTGQMILSSWNQIHGGSFFLPYVVPNGGSSTPAPYGETEEPETPEEPT